MDYDEFRSSIDRIYDYFQTKHASPATCKLWSYQVKGIPIGPPLRAIEQEIMDKDSLPRNIPKAYKTAWEAWLNANQDKVARERDAARTACPTCGGSGLIFSYREDNKYRYVSRCTDCENWSSHISQEAAPRLSIFQLERQGHIIER